MYCLHTACFTKAELRKLDGFHARCLRKIFNIPHAYYSRVSNKEVLARASVTTFSGQLLRHQLMLLRQVALWAGEQDTLILPLANALVGQPCVNVVPSAWCGISYRSVISIGVVRLVVISLRMSYEVDGLLSLGQKEGKSVLWNVRKGDFLLLDLL